MPGTATVRSIIQTFIPLFREVFILKQYEYWLDEFNDAYNAVAPNAGNEFCDDPMTILEQSKEDFSGNNIIFLDVDGVLNCTTTKHAIKGYTGLDDSKIAILKEMRDMLDAKIVLTSTWKYDWYPYNKDEQDAFAMILDYHLQDQGLTIIDKTVDPNEMLRGCGIIDWIKKQKDGVGKILILDDETFDYKGCGLRKHQIQTSYYDPNGGLGERHLLKLRQILPTLDYKTRG